MTLLYYNEENKSFFQLETEDTYSLGKDNKQLPTKKQASFVSFLMKKNAQKLGPLVGILTSARGVSQIEGNKGTFERIQNFLQQDGGVSIVFTPFSLRETSLLGYLFLPQQKKWVTVQCPYPDVVYNRIPFPEDEQQSAIQETIRTLQERNISLFNPCFFDKFNIYNQLSENIHLRKHLPPTTLLSTPKDLVNFLMSYPDVYVKKKVSSQGKGVFHLYKQNNTLLYKSIGQSPTKISISDMWKILVPNQYIAQQTIHCKQINKQKYDLRVLAHFVNNTFRISGIGIRLAKKDEIATHLTNGGSILPLSSLNETINQEKILFLIQTSGEILRTHYGPVCEFSMDIGIGIDGEYYIFEINSKPMVFDEETIKLQGLIHLRQIFDELGT